IGEGPSPLHGADGVEFNQLARQVAQGNGYTGMDGRPTSFRAPGFPFFLAGLHVLSGTHYPVSYVSFCLLGALSCFFTFLIARTALSERTALLAAGLNAIYPPHIYFATVFESENLFVPLLGLTLWLFLRYLESRSFTPLILTGLVLGWAVLTRPFALL